MSRKKDFSYISIIVFALLIVFSSAWAGIIATNTGRTFYENRSIEWTWLMNPWKLTGESGWDTVDAWTPATVTDQVDDGYTGWAQASLPDGVTIGLFEYGLRNVAAGEVAGIGAVGNDAAGSDDDVYRTRRKTRWQKFVQINSSKQVEYYQDTSSNSVWFLVAYGKYGKPIGMRPNFRGTTGWTAMELRDSNTTGWDADHLDFSGEALFPRDANGVMIRILSAAASNIVYQYAMRGADSVNSKDTDSGLIRDSAATFNWGFVGLDGLKADINASNVLIDGAAAMWFDNSSGIQFVRNAEVDPYDITAQVHALTDAAWSGDALNLAGPVYPGSAAVLLRIHNTSAVATGLKIREYTATWDNNSADYYDDTVDIDSVDYHWVPVYSPTGETKTIEMKSAAFDNFDVYVVGQSYGATTPSTNLCAICSALPDYTPPYVEVGIGDSVMWHNLPECSDVYSKASIDINSYLKNYAGNAARLYGGVVRNIQDQYRISAGCCAAACSAGNTCGFDYIIVQGGGNDMVALCPEATDPAVCPAACDDDVVTINGRWDNIISDIGYQTSGKERIILTGMYPLITPAPPPPNDWGWDHRNQCFVSMNNLNRAKAVASKLIYWVDSSAVMNTGTPTLYESDNIHPNNLGSDAIGNLIANAIQAAELDDCSNRLSCQNFEGTGYDGGESWTEAGTTAPNEDYATAPLNGLQSLYLTDTGSDPTTYVSFANQSTLWVAFAGRLSANPSVAGTYDLMRIQDSSGNTLARVAWNRTSSTYRLQAFHGTAGGSTCQTAGISTTVPQYVWTRYIKDPGADTGTMDLYTSLTPSKPGAPTCTIAVGTSDANAGRVQFTWSGTPSAKIDQVLVDDAGGIGSLPASYY